MKSKFDPLLGRRRTVDQGITVEKHFISGGGSGSGGASSHSELTGVTSDQHHTQAHAIDGADHTGQLSYNDLSDLPTLVTDHDDLTGLTDDDHTNYALLAGRSGGQTLKGGTASGDDLTLMSTNNATKGSLLFGTSAYDEVNNRLGIGTATPGYNLDISASGIASQVHISGGAADSGGYFTNTVSTDLYMSGGAAFDGAAWIAKDTTASIIGVVAGNIRGYANSALTAGNSFTVTERFRFTPTQFIVNTGAFDYDTNLRGDNDANAFYLKASTDSIGLGTATPDSKLEINHDISALHGLTVQTTNNTFTNAGPYSLRIQTSSAVNRIVANNYGQMAMSYSSSATGNAISINNAGNITMLSLSLASMGSSDPGLPIRAIQANVDKTYVSSQQTQSIAAQFRVNNSGGTDNGLNTGAYYFSEIQGSSVVANIYGQYNHVRNSSSGNSTNMYGVRALVDFANNATGVVTNAYGFHAVVGGGTGASPTNLYGLYINNVDDGVTINSAITTNAGNVVFNEGGDASTDFRVETDNNTHQLFVDGGADAVGIDQSSPTALLHIGAGSASANTAPLKLTSGTITTTAEVGTQEYNGNFYQTRTGPVRYGLGGAIFDKFSDTGNSGTTETDLQTNTLVANTFNANGDKVIAEYGGTFVDSATATRRLRVYFGGTEIANTGLLTTTPAASWRVWVLLIRVSSSVVRYVVHLSTSSSALVTTDSVGEVTGLTLSNTQIVKITGQAGGVGAADNDIVLKLGRVEFDAAA